ncbi:hypothetical protein ACTFOB_08150 [Bacillus cereus group sp. MYBK79-1]|uniref:hypothetical protein n=1 Tax=unclassified Bacillus cereus group TaxID=2750818 RepID=UPI003F78E667
MFKKTIFLFSICLMFIVGCRPEPPPPSLFWNDISYRITDEPIEEKNVGPKIGEITKEIETNQKPNTKGESNVLKETTEIFETLNEGRKEKYPALIIKEPSSNEYKVARPMLKLK